MEQMPGDQQVSGLRQILSDDEIDELLASDEESGTFGELPTRAEMAERIKVMERRLVQLSAQVEALTRMLAESGHLPEADSTESERRQHAVPESTMVTLAMPPRHQRHRKQQGWKWFRRT